MQTIKATHSGGFYSLARSLHYLRKDDKMKQVLVEHIVTAESNQVKSDAVLFNGEAFVFHNTGLTRRVYANKTKTKVVKVPITEMDFEHNRKEADLWETASEQTKLQLTPCRLLPNGWLEMDFLYTLNDPETEDKFGHVVLTNLDIQFASSCRNEVGYDAEGKLRCYDYDEYKKY